ncbi:MAG: hypothetical protein JWR87_1384 [Segetibacter sp.]|jgi:hypothetical protein|nr:hypothetical protein [Segetibacter sp.]
MKKLSVLEDPANYLSIVIRIISIDLSAHEE